MKIPTAHVLSKIALCVQCPHTQICWRPYT